MSIIRIKHKDLNKLNESIQRIALFEDDVDNTKIQKDDTDDTFFTDINTDNEENVVNNVDNDTDLSFIDDEDPEVKKQQLIADFTNIMQQQIDTNKAMEDLLAQYKQLSSTDTKLCEEWKIDNAKHDIYLQSKDAHVFRQNRNLCVSFDQQVESFTDEAKLQEFLKKHDMPEIPQDMLGNLVESTEDQIERLLTEAPLWAYGAKAKDAFHNFGQKIKDKFSQYQKNVKDSEVFGAIDKNQLQFLQACVDHNVNMKDMRNIDSATPLIYAAHKGNLDAVKILAQDKDMINTVDREGNPATFFTTLKANKDNRVEMLKTLIDAGADINIKNKYGNTLKNLIKQEKLSDLAQVLKDTNTSFDGKSQDPNAQPGETELMSAAKNGDAQQVQDLIDKGADVNAEDENGRTAAMYAQASMKSNDEVVDTLARNGADMNKKDKTGKSANDYGEIAYHKKQQTQNQDQPQQDTNVDQKLQQQNTARKDIITHLVDTGKANLNARTADQQQQTAADIANKFHDNDMYKFLKSRGGKTSNELDNPRDRMDQKPTKPQKSNKESTEEEIEESFKPKLNPNRARYDDSYMEYLKNLAKLREKPKKECGCCGGGVSIGSAGLDGVAAVTPGSTKKKK